MDLKRDLISTTTKNCGIEIRMYEKSHALNEIMEPFISSVLWARNTLNQYGYHILDVPRMVRSMPWSTVISFQTSEGSVYLKYMEKDFAYEPALLEYLNKQKFPNLPSIIAINKGDNSFLMKDAGDPLRVTLRESYNTSLVCLVLRSCAKLQIACISHANSLIKLGASDWRLNKLPQLYQNFLSRKQLLIADGLTLNEIEVLQSLSGLFENLCQSLEAFSIPETLEHGDFHDNNVLLSKDKITINDFGDSTVSHPFFSITSFLSNTKRHYDFNGFSNIYVILRDCYLQEWEICANKDVLLQAFDIALLVQPFIAGMNLARIESCPDSDVLLEYHGHMAEQLRILINNMTAYKNGSI